MMKLSTTSKFCFILTGIPIILATWFWIFDLRFNLSGSMPIGLYQLQAHQTPKRGDWVAVCLPNAVVRVAMEEHALHRGSCESGVEPVLKQIIAVPGDTVLLTDQEMIVNGIAYAAPKLIQEVPLQKDGYWLYGVGDPTHSWDSRYFGAVSAQAIQGVVKPLFVKMPAEFSAEWDSSHNSSRNS